MVLREGGHRGSLCGAYGCFSRFRPFVRGNTGKDIRSAVRAPGVLSVRDTRGDDRLPYLKHPFRRKRRRYSGRHPRDPYRRCSLLGDQKMALRRIGSHHTLQRPHNPCSADTLAYRHLGPVLLFCRYRGTWRNYCVRYPWNTYNLLVRTSQKESQKE